jgi:cytoskeleton protein RodZ
MSDHQDQHAGMPDEEEARPSVTPGELLASKREQSGLSHATVGEALHLTVHYIKALESNEYSKLPGQTFVKGYIRSYARYLQMDIPAVLACYEEHLSRIGIDSGSEYGAGMRKRSDQTLLWAVAAGVVLVIALFAGWWFFGRTDSRAPATAQITTPAPRPVATNALTPEPVRTTTPAFNVNPVVAPVVDAAQQASAEMTTIQETNGLDELVAAVSASNAAAPPADTTVETIALDIPAEVEDIAMPETAPEETAGQAAAIEAPVAAVTTDAAGEAPSEEPPDTVVAGPRHVNLLGEGEDFAEFTLRGNSWIEVNDAEGNRVFEDMLEEDDTLSIRGTAPFAVLLGDARNVSLRFNENPVDLASSTRSDNTARLQLGTGEEAR